MKGKMHFLNIRYMGILVFFQSAILHIDIHIFIKLGVSWEIQLPLQIAPLYQG